MTGKGKGADTPPRANCLEPEGCWSRERRRARSAGKVSPSPGPGGDRLLTRNPGPRSRPDTMEPGRGPGRGRAVAPCPRRAPTPPRPAPARGGAPGAAPASRTPRGSRLGPDPLRLLGSRVAAAPGREAAKEEGRGGEESPAGKLDGGRGPGLGRQGRRGATGGGPGVHGPSRRAGGRRAAAVPHHVGVLQASPLLLRLRSEWTAAAAAAPLTGSPGSRSCAVRGGPGAARGGRSGPREAEGPGPAVGALRGASPGAGGAPGRGPRGGGGCRGPSSSRHHPPAAPGGVRRGGGPGTAAPLPTRSFCCRTAPVVSTQARGGDERWPVKSS